MNPYSPRQLEVANILNEVGEEGISSDVIDQVLAMVEEAEQKSSESPVQKKESIDLIKLRLLDEQDWRKRAQLSALLISKSLED